MHSRRLSTPTRHSKRIQEGPRHTYIRTYIHAYTHIHTYMCTYTHPYIHTYRSIYIYTYTSEAFSRHTRYPYQKIYVCTHICMDVYIYSGATTAAYQMRGVKWSFSFCFLHSFTWWQDRRRLNPMHFWNCSRPVDQKKWHLKGLLYERLLCASWPEKGAHRRTSARTTLSMHLWHCIGPVGQKNGTWTIYCTGVFFGHHDQKKVHTDELLYAQHFAASPVDICQYFHFEVFNLSDVCIYIISIYRFDFNFEISDTAKCSNCAYSCMQITTVHRRKLQGTIPWTLPSGHTQEHHFPR